FVVDAVDTTGAGDVFRAGFIYAMLRGDDVAGILRFACAAAAVSCTRRGAINSVPSLVEVDALLSDRAALRIADGRLRIHRLTIEDCRLKLSMAVPNLSRQSTVCNG